MKDLVVIAIGGNSLIKDPQHMTVFDQYKATGETSEHIAGIIERGYRVIVTHGNGPQVGFILLRSEMAKEVLHQLPLPLRLEVKTSRSFQQIDTRRQRPAIN